MSIWDNAQGLWALNEDAGNTSGWLDVSTTNNNDVTGTNSPTARNGFGGGSDTAVGFTSVGTVPFLEITGAAQTGLDGGANDFTVACWMLVNSFGTGTRYLVNKGGSGQNGYRLQYDGTSQTPGVKLASPAQSNAITLWATQSLALDTWYHVGFTYKNSNQLTTMYVDGIAVGTGTAASTDIRSNNAGFTLGVFDSGNFSGRHLGGMDDVGVWTRQLSTAEMLTLTESTGENFGAAPAFTEATFAASLSLVTQITATKIVATATTSVSLVMGGTINATRIRGISITSPLTLEAQVNINYITIGSFSDNLTLSASISANCICVMSFSASLTMVTAITATKISGAVDITKLVGVGPLFISETISLGAGGFYTSSVYPSDRVHGLSGYTQSKSSDVVLIINQSINSAFTSAVSESITINSLGIPVEFSLLSLPGRNVRYSINAVDSASQIEFNMFGVIE